MHPTPRRRKPSRLLWLFVLLALVAVGGIFQRVHHARALHREAEESAVTQVTVVAPKQGPLSEELVLPSNVVAWHEATIYARTSGYLKKWYTPMGTPVKQGDLLAEIETPEVDAQLRQAEADVKTAQATSTLAQLTAKRWQGLRKSDSVSKQEADEKTGDAQAKAAALASAEAGRDHLRELKAFGMVRAPFDGIITSRTTDIGQLIASGSETQQPLFHIVQADRLRVYTRVPQNDASRITPQVHAEVIFTDHPGHPYPAKFLKTAEAIEQASRTMLVEFMIDNKDNGLLAGGYGEIHLALPGVASSLRLPVNALIFRADGLQVATVDADNKASLHTVVMGRDFGNEVEIASGIGAQDRVIVNPPDSLISGQPVRIAEPRKENKTDGAKDTPAK